MSKFELNFYICVLINKKLINNLKFNPYENDLQNCSYCFC